MLHKYYLSEQVGYDVGLLKAFKDYATQFNDNKRTMEKMDGILA